MLDRGLVGPWIQKNMPGAAYSFTHVTPDINGDGFVDAIVAISSPQIRRSPLKGEGSITLVAYRIGRSLIVVGETMALDVGLRRLPSSEQEVAFIDFEGIRGIGD